MSTLKAIFYDILHRVSIPSRDQEEQKKTFTPKLGIAKFHSILLFREQIFFVLLAFGKSEQPRKHTQPNCLDTITEHI